MADAAEPETDMPERPTRRAWTARIPLRLVIAVLAALATLAATACTGDDGLSPYRPDRGIAGTWVRYQPPSPHPADVAFVPRDTLFLAVDGSGRWSYETWTAPGIMARSQAVMELEVRLPFLFLNYAPCPNCEARIAANRVATLTPPAAPRLETRIDAPHFRVVRDGPDLIELVPVWAPAAVQHFRRTDPPAASP